MDTSSFHIDWLALGIAIVFLVFQYAFFSLLAKKILKPKILVPTLQAFMQEKSFKNWLSRYSLALLYVSLGFFLLAFIDPRVFFPRQDLTKESLPNVGAAEGIAIFLILDHSGSMQEKVNAKIDGTFQNLSKMEILKQVTKDFIQGNPKYGLTGRTSDLIGLIDFARSAQVLSPLTLDHAAILKLINQLKPATDPEEKGTSIGYAIYKTASILAATRHYAEDLPEDEKPSYAIKSAAMILVTDGLQEINPQDEGKPLRSMGILEAAAFVKQQNIKLYFINIDPKIASEKYAPNRHQMERAAESTGGKFYLADSSIDLPQIYASIDKLEKSSLPGQWDLLQNKLSKDELPHFFKRFSFSPYLIIFGLMSLLAAVFISTVLARTVP